MRRPSSPSKSNACAAGQAGFTGAPGGRFSFLRCSRSSYPSVKRLLTITGVNVHVAAGLVAADWRHPTLLLAAKTRELCRVQSAGAPIGSWSGAAWGYSYAELPRTIAVLSSTFPAGEMVFFIPWRVVAEDSGAAHLDLLGPAWSVQRQLAAQFDGEVAGCSRRSLVFCFGLRRFPCFEICNRPSARGSFSAKPDRCGEASRAQTPRDGAVGPSVANADLADAQIFRMIRDDVVTGK